MNMRDGVYQQQLTLNPVTGSSPTNTITFQSESGDSTAVTIRYFINSQSAHYVFRVLASNVIIRNLSIESPALNWDGGITLAGSNNLIEHVRFFGPSTFTVGNNGFVHLDAAVSATIRNCTFQEKGSGITTSGGATRVTVTGNEFFNQHTEALDLRWVDTLLVSHNRIWQDGTGNVSNGFEAMNMSSSMVADIHSNQTELYRGKIGARLGSMTGPMRFFNNMIHLHSDNVWFGVSVNNCASPSIVHNSIYVAYDGNSSVTYGPALEIDLGCTNVTVLNNIVSSLSPNVPGAVYGTSSTYANVDHNLYYAAGTTAEFNGTPTSNLGTYQALAAPHEQNTVFANPLFLLEPDLHAPDAVANNAGTYVADVAIDFDGEPRSTTAPDIGADEYTPPGPLTFNQVTTTNILCNGEINGTATATFSGGLGYFTYSWSNGDTTATISGLASGDYTVTVIDGVGDTITGSGNVAEPAVLFGTLTPTLTNCNASTGSLFAATSGGTGAYTYAWSDGQTTGTATGLAQGSYTVTISDANGCTYSTLGTVNEPPNIIGSTTENGSSCTGSTGSASVMASGGTGTLSYLWSDGQTGTTATGLAPGTYTVTASDTANCSQTYTVDIVALGAPSVTTSGMDASCFGCCDGSASANPTGGSTPYTYLWSDGQTTDTATGLCAGTYMVDITDNAGCVVTDSVSVGEPTGLMQLTHAALPGMRVYPVPANQRLAVELPATTREGVLEVYSATGQLVLRERVQQAGLHELATNQLPEGVYGMVLVSGGQRWHQRFVVAH